MARKAMVSRTIESTLATVLVADLKTEKVQDVVIEVAGKFNTDAKLLEAVEGSLDLTALKPIYVKSAEVKETLLGMYEDDFIKQAIVLDPKTRKPYEAETGLNPAE